MRKSFSPSLSNSNSLTTNKIFGVPLNELQQQGHPGNGVPYIVKHIVEYLEEYGVEQEGLFKVNGSAEMVEWLRQKYDSGEEVDLVKEADVSSAVSLLRLFLQELPEAVIPASLHTHLMQLYQDNSIEDDFGRKLKCFLQQLPAVNYNLLKFLCRFLVKVTSQKEEKWTASSLAAVFGLDVFHIYTDVEDMKEQEAASNIMSELLENYNEFFGTEEFLSTDISNSFHVEVTKSCEQVEKIEQTDVLPEDCEETLYKKMGTEHLEITKNITEPDNIVLSASAPVSPSNRVPANTQILERTIRAVVEQHLFDLQSNIDQNFKPSQFSTSSNDLVQYSGCDVERPRKTNDLVEENTNIDVSKVTFLEDLQHTDSLEGKDEQPSLHIPTLEALNNDSYLDAGNVVKNVSLPKDPLLNTSKESLDNGPIVDEENNIKAERQESSSDSETDIDFKSTLGFATGVYDLNANTESDVPARRSVSFRADKVRPEIAPLDLKKVAETCDWEAPCTITFPFIDFKTMHLQRDGNDPVPAFKSWQDEYEHELGEAQLSPQAGRLTSHPLEEDPQPMLCRRYLNFGHSQRFLREPDSLISLKGPTSFRPRRSSFDSKDEEKEEQTRLQLTKKLQSIKKKIKLYEDQFEKERKYKPSHSDKAANPKVLKWMNELVKLRKQMKEAKSRTIEKDLEILPQARPRSNTLPKSFGSCLEHERGDAHHRETPGKEAKPSMEATLEAILNRLKEKRAEEDWPEDIKEMRQNHLAAEKVALQKSLLYFESIHGRPVTREQRQLVKPLYDRYRLVKQILTKANLIPIIGSPSTKRRGQTLQPIIEGETAHFFEEIKEEDEEEDDCNMTASFADTLKLGCHTRTFLDQLESEHDTIEHSGEETSAKLNLDLGASSIHAASMPELLEQLWKARADKKKLRKALREFEGEFYRQNGRNVQKEDRTPMIEEYREYKHIKARCRLLEVLISKQDSAKSI
ncbi:protein FAM13B isoform X1 [Callorhinchus milii]|uniref:Family with sequence similarity 13 member B n=2 Tax=Callorhinchus milii TaxID=7868 RepID=V9K8C9_CALMI|nr:protein FAM13B isoform X1 [Callorhinchus milii]XP_042195789.1 protein FAM13B isoform X1 [Callorhinchus milii]